MVIWLETKESEVLDLIECKRETEKSYHRHQQQQKQ